jgi:transcription termination factor Rho
MFPAIDVPPSGTRRDDLLMSAVYARTTDPARWTADAKAGVQVWSAW